EPDSDQTKALRALCRGREDLVATRVALANQLRAELERFWPAPVGLFSQLDTPRGPRPDLTATQRMLSDTVTGTAARRAEREALDGKPTSAISLRG
ncbi:MAG: hypothetical protein WBP81_10455, partial [Solirubrobacteraceae bacterium]